MLLVNVLYDKKEVRGHIENISKNTSFKNIVSKLIR